MRKPSQMDVCLVVQPIHPAGVTRLEKAGVVCRLASRSDMETVGREIPNATAVLTRSAGLSAAAMDAAPKLRVIASHGIGFDAIAVSHATQSGIAVVNTPYANRQSVAEHVFALLLSLARQVTAADQAVRAGDLNFQYRTTLREIFGKTLGIVGFGGIGRRVAEIGRSAFGMEVLVASASADKAEVEQCGYRHVALDDLLRHSDVVSLHQTLRESTRHMIDARALRMMQPHTIIINTARGALIDEDALVAALTANQIAGAGLDVFAMEHLPTSHPLLHLDNVVLSPHIAGSTQEALKRTAEHSAEQIWMALCGQRPTHLVNPEVWARRRR